MDYDVIPPCIMAGNRLIHFRQDWRARLVDAFKKIRFSRVDHPEAMLIGIGACMYGGIDEAEELSAADAHAVFTFLDTELRANPLPKIDDEPDQVEDKHMKLGSRILDLE